MSCHFFSTKVSSLVRTFVVRELSSESDWCRFLKTCENNASKEQISLTISSCTSLKADAINTTANGAIVVYLLVGETPGICCMQAVNKKNKLAYLENCSVCVSAQVTDIININVPKRNFGRNVARLYLLVETKFEQ